MPPSRVQIRRQLEEALAPLEASEIREILRLLLHREDDAAALDVLNQVQLPIDLALSDPEWREGLLDVLEERLSPEDREDQDEVPTTMMPDYAEIAKDLRADDDA